MNKYKVGDKIVLTVSDVNEKAYYSYYVFNNNDLILWEPSTDNYAEPLSTYTEPLEAKIRRQAAEITRLRAENKRLKAENGNVIWEIEQAFDRGCNAAWELARKCMLMTDREREAIFGSGHNALYGVLTYFDYKNAAAKVAQWEKATIKRGDEVEKNDLRDARFIVTFTNGKLMSGVTQSGLVFSNEKTKDWHKTGRHIDIDGFLKQIGEE